MKRILLVAVVAALPMGCSCGSDDDADGNSTSSGGAGTGGAGNGGAGLVGTGGGAVSCFADLETIELAPADSTVTLDGGPAAAITFTATGNFADGNSVELPSTGLEWEVTRGDDTPPGDIAAGVLEPFPQAGGVVTVSATDTCVTGTTTVTFDLDVTIGQPSDPGAWAGNPVTGDPSPNIVYPTDQTRFPRNIYRTLFQWYTEDFTEFRLVFDGPNSTVQVYTDGAHGLCASANPTAGCWEVDEVAWNFIAASNAGATASWVVDALDTSTDPPTVRRSDPIEIGFSKQDVEGAIFYWSTTSAGIRRGRISQVDPEDYIVGKPTGTDYAGNEVGCVACHTVSRDGKYMVAPVKASETEDSLWVMEVTDQAPPNPTVTSVADTGGHGFGTISPDNEHVVVSFKEDWMWMVNRATGAHEADLPTQAFDGGTHPDWAPDGTQLVFATGKGDGPGDASLALIPWDGSAWGTPSILLPPVNNQSNLFPMFSPDSNWIAFAVGDGGHGDETAQLHVIEQSGGTAIEMIAANRMTSNAMTDGQYQNSQPTWAPPGDFDWVAFNTKREYGVVLDEGTQQIWISAIDLDKAAQGDDPSYPAFRVPFQGLDENNHRAFWTLDVSDGGGGAGGGGTGGAGGGPAPCSDILTIGETCDILNDCCEGGSLCDTQDSGVTYVCIAAN